MQEVTAALRAANHQNKPLPEACRAMLELWLSQAYGPVLQEYDNFEAQNPAFAEILNRAACVSWILDLRCLQFNFMSRNVQELTGYSPDLFTAGGLDFALAITHPDDLPHTWAMVRKIWEMLLDLAPEARRQYTFTHDYRQHTANGSLLRILEQCSILQQDNSGNITHLMGICSDITHLPKPAAPTATLHCHQTNTNLHLHPETKEQAPAFTLSKRELEIVKLIAAGYSSKLIADKLCIGFHTVNTHRQNILRKTNTKNTGEFVQVVLGGGVEYRKY